MHVASPLRAVMWALTGMAVLLGAAVAFIATLDWDGKSYDVRNGCRTTIYVDNGHDGLPIEPGESLEVASFKKDRLELQIGGDLSRPNTWQSVSFADRDVVVEGDLCP